MAQVALAPKVAEDLERIARHLLEVAPDTVEARGEAILSAITLLETSPLIGRPAAHGLRELVIGRGASGFVALYRYDARTDRALVLAIRGQREAGFRDV